MAGLAAPSEPRLARLQRLDGYTICVISIAHAVNPALYTLKYDPHQIIHADLNLRDRTECPCGQSDVTDQIGEGSARARQTEAGRTQLRLCGRGRLFQHLGAELFKLQAHINLVHVPYKGGGPAMQDVIAGHVKIMFSSLVQTTPFIKSGQLIALGTGGAKRSPVLPDVPTIAEAGVPGYVADNWWGLAAPAGLPKPIVDKLYSATQAALKSPELQSAFDREGAATVEMTSVQFADYIKTEIAKWARVVKEGNIHAQ